VTRRPAVRPSIRAVARRSARGARAAAARAGTALRLVHVALAAAGVEAALRFLRLPTVARLAGVELRLDGGWRPAPSGDLPLTPRESRAVELAVSVLRRGPIDDSCLRRSLLVGHLLRRRRPVLEIGVTKRDGVVRAHAWLEVQGATLDGGLPEGYALLAPPARGRGPA
jgi:hypothetical protein